MWTRPNSFHCDDAALVMAALGPIVRIVDYGFEPSG